MILTMVVAVAALLAVILLWSYARKDRVTVRTVEELMAHSMPVDLECFRNLIDPSEEQYLRENLPAREFRAIQRARIRASIEYVQRTSHNAALLLRVGENARRNTDPGVARAGEQLVQSALQLRVYSVLTTALLFARLLAPTARLTASSFVQRYEGLRERTAGLARLQVPATASRVEASL